MFLITKQCSVCICLITKQCSKKIFLSNFIFLICSTEVESLFENTLYTFEHFSQWKKCMKICVITNHGTKNDWVGFYSINLCKMLLNAINKSQRNRMLWNKGARVRMCHIKEFKRGIKSTPVLMLWGGGHFDHHVWRWVIVPPDLPQSFSAICATYHCCVFAMR